MKNYLKKFISIKSTCSIFLLFTFNFKLSNFKNIFWYIRDYFNITSSKNYINFSVFGLTPCLDDKTSLTPIEPVYFYQDTWAARKTFELNPKTHFDVGSSVKTIGILSQFTPLTMIDILSLPLALPNLNFIKRSILNLPFDDNSIGSISSLCVVERIGLGRYGDRVDNFGSENQLLNL